MGDAKENAIDFGDELGAEPFALAFVPDRCFLELGLGDRFDPEFLHGLRERVASTAARARATESSRE